MMLSEEVNLKFKAEFRMLGISLTENRLKEHKSKELKCNRMFKEQVKSVLLTNPRARTDKTLHLEHLTISKTERLSDQKIMICKTTAEVEATTMVAKDKKWDRRLELNTEEKKIDQEEELNKKNNSKSNNFLTPKALDKKWDLAITRKTLLTMTTEELLINMKDKKRDKNRETVLRHSGMTETEVNLEAKRVLNLRLEQLILTFNYAVTFNLIIN